MSHFSGSEGGGIVRPQAALEPRIIVDKREKLPYFAQAKRKTMETADYGLEGHQIGIERKSLPDLFSTIGSHRSRFQREWERLAQLDYGAVVVEASLADILLRPPPHSQLHPHAAINTLLAWSVRYRIPVFFCGDREHARSTTYHLLKHFAWYAQEGTLVR